MACPPTTACGKGEHQLEFAWRDSISCSLGGRMAAQGRMPEEGPQSSEAEGTAGTSICVETVPVNNPQRGH